MALPHSPSSSTGVNQAEALCKTHAQRFNYLFHDGHVETLRITSTVGTGSTNNPRGNWAVRAGD